MSKPIDLDAPWHPSPPKMERPVPRPMNEDCRQGTVKPPPPLPISLRQMNENGELLSKSSLTYGVGWALGFGLGVVTGIVLIVLAMVLGRSLA